MKKNEKMPEVIVPEVVECGTYSELVNAIGGLLERARSKIAAVANFELVKTYWETGRYIVEYEQHGADRAKYGEGLIVNLSKDLRLRYGRGYSRTNLIYMRKLYQTFRKSQTLSDLLSWSHYLEILQCTDELAIHFYCAECARSRWNVRELRRQIRSSLFERLALSKDKKGILALARNGAEVQAPEDILRDRYVLEFTGIKLNERYVEGDLHSVLVERMKTFMLELGKGFAFVRSKYNIPINTSHPHAVDLVFYNYYLKCFVLIDLKRDKVAYGDVGQMNMYLNYFRAEECPKGDNEPIGIVLCADKDDVMVEYAIQGITNKIFVSRYQLYLPDKELLRRELARAIEEESCLENSLRAKSRKKKLSKRTENERAKPLIKTFSALHQ